MKSSVSLERARQKGASWDVGRSGLETLTAGAVAAGSVFQPRIENRNYGFIVDLRHHW
jgi:hypothetical protein